MEHTLKCQKLQNTGAEESQTSSRALTSDLPNDLDKPIGIGYQRISKKLDEASDGELSDLDEGDEEEPSILVSKESGVSIVTKSAHTFDTVFDNLSKSQQSPSTVTSALPSTVEYNFQDIFKRILEDNESQSTWTSFNSESIETGHLRVPELPSEALVRKVFRCTICGDRLRNITDRLKWK